MTVPAAILIELAVVECHHLDVIRQENFHVIAQPVAVQPRQNYIRTLSFQPTNIHCSQTMPNGS
jgi:hypothetical protein